MVNLLNSYDRLKFYRKIGIISIMILAFILSVNTCYAAVLHGIIYDSSLDPAKNVIITVDSVPEQRLVTKDGSYSFNLLNGDYTVIATFQSGASKYYAKSIITIENEGYYVLDLILFPDISEEEDILNEEIEFQDIYFDSEDKISGSIIAVSIIAGIAVIFLIIYFILSKKSYKKRSNPVIDHTLEEAVLGFIKSKNGKVNQKEIRKNFGVSEAKISLVIKQLEKEEIIKRIRQGRENIIVLEENKN